MASKAGLRKVTKTVRGKKGVVKRSYWVRAKQSVKNAGTFALRHKGKILGGVALAAGAFQFSKWVKRERDTVRRTPPNAAFMGHSREHIGWGFAKQRAMREHDREARNTPTMEKNGWSHELLRERQADHRAPAKLGSGEAKPTPTRAVGGKVPPKVDFFHRHEYVNPEVQSRNYRSNATNFRTFKKRHIGNVTGRAPLQLGSGTKKK